MNLVYNAAGNAAIIEKVNSLGMGAQGSSADFASIAAYLDAAKPTITLADAGARIDLWDIIESKAVANAGLKIIQGIVTVTPPTKGTVSYQTGNGFGAPSYVFYTPFPGQSGVDTWTYQGIGDYGLNTTVRTASVMITPPEGTAPPSYQGLWWKSDEPYWGVNLAHQGDRIFATWYTYDTSGNAYWLSMLATRTTSTSNVYSGDVNVSVGPPFNNFVGNFVPTKVGDGTITFSDANNGSLFYEVTAGGGTNVKQTRPITRYSLGGAQPTCTYSASPNLAAATNYQDLWWAPGEDGWGVNFAHQGDQLFATWYTYDAKSAGGNAPLWLSALMQRVGTSNTFTGPLTRTSGPRFDNYKASDVVQPIPTVGTATATFTDGNHSMFHYVTSGTGGLPVVDQAKSITRFLFAGPAGTTCQ